MSGSDAASLGEGLAGESGMGTWGPEASALLAAAFTAVAEAVLGGPVGNIGLREEGASAYLILLKGTEYILSCLAAF